MMNYETIVYTQKEGLGLITFNRPEQGNALNEQMIKDVDGALDEAEKDRKSESS